MVNGKRLGDLVQNTYLLSVQKPVDTILFMLPLQLLLGKDLCAHRHLSVEDSLAGYYCLSPLRLWTPVSQEYYL